MTSQARVYVVTGRGEALDGRLGAAVNSVGARVEGRESSALATLRFSEQLATIRTDLRAAYWHTGALLVGHSYGAYLLLHTLADLTAFPGGVLLLAPVLGMGRSADGLYASRPPRARRLLELAESSGFASPARLDIHVGSNDRTCDDGQVQRFVAGIPGAVSHSVEGAGHSLDDWYLQQTLRVALQRAGREAHARYRPPDESGITVPGRGPLLTPALDGNVLIPRPAGSCPQCGSMDAARITYGHPMRGADEPPGTIRGGCCIGPHSPDHACRSCRFRWQELEAQSWRG